MVSTYLGGDGYSPALATINGKLRDYRPGALAAEAAFYYQVRGEIYDQKDKTDRFAAGEEEYNWRLTHCLNVPRRAAELYEYGAEQVAWYTGKIFDVAEAVARGARLQLPFATEEEKRQRRRAVPLVSGGGRACGSLRPSSRLDGLLPFGATSCDTGHFGASRY